MVEHDNMDEALGRGLEVELGGRTFTMSQLTLGDWKAFRTHIRGQRIKAALEGGAEFLSPDDRRQVTVDLASATISQFEQAQEFVTPSGLVFMLWRSILRHHPDVSQEEIEKLAGEEDLEKIAGLQEGLNTDPDAPDEEADPTEAGIPSDGTTASPSSSGITDGPSPTSTD